MSSFEQLPVSGSRMLAASDPFRLLARSQVKPADSLESPFRDLELMELWEGVSHRCVGGGESWMRGRG